jgi:hypothetical protein
MAANLFLVEENYGNGFLHLITNLPLGGPLGTNNYEFYKSTKTGCWLTQTQLSFNFLFQLYDFFGQLTYFKRLVRDFPFFFRYLRRRDCLRNGSSYSTICLSYWLLIFYLIYWYYWLRLRISNSETKLPPRGNVSIIT